MKTMPETLEKYIEDVKKELGDLYSMEIENELRIDYAEVMNEMSGQFY
jgi:hypothetical protein